MRSKKLQKPQGFTLIELMITVAILGIIAAVALPSYQNSVRKANRADAKASLMAMAQGLERCLTAYGKYDHADCTATAKTSSDEGKYTISAVVDEISYTLTASAPSTSSQIKDTDCRKFFITNTGDKTSEDSGATASTNCWK